MLFPRTLRYPRLVRKPWDGDGLDIGEEAKLAVFPLAIVKDDGALPASFLVVIELAEVGNDVLARPGLGAYALDEGVVGMGLTVFSPGIASQEHAGLPRDQHERWQR